MHAYEIDSSANRTVGTHADNMLHFLGIAHMDKFVIGFWIVSALCAILYVYTRTKVTTPPDANFRSFQRTYLIVYLLAMGPYDNH